jgi:hypothetical protein
MMIPVQNYVHQDNHNYDKNTMDMTSILLDALNQRIQQQRLPSLQEVSRPPPPPPRIQSHSAQYLPANASINVDQNNLPASISVDGQLYALLPISNHDVVRPAENPKEHRFQYSGPLVGSMGSMGASQPVQRRDDSNTLNGGNALLASAAVIPLKTSKRVNKDNTGGVKRRPKIRVPPKAFVSILEPNVNDVLLGRGGRINKHFGNVQLRNIVAARQDEYLSSSTGKLDKAYIAAEIVAAIRLQFLPPGRFLEQNSTDHTWYEVGDERAIRKVLQALREHAPEYRSAATAAPSPHVGLESQI